MPLFIGGAARTGKGILARRLLSDMQLPFLNLDVINHLIEHPVERGSYEKSLAIFY